jgi:hypothetical protein
MGDTLMIAILWVNNHERGIRENKLLFTDIKTETLSWGWLMRLIYVWSSRSPTPQIQMWRCTTACTVPHENVIIISYTTEKLIFRPIALPEEWRKAFPYIYFFPDNGTIWKLRLLGNCALNLHSYNVLCTISGISMWMGSETIQTTPSC